MLNEEDARGTGDDALLSTIADRDAGFTAYQAADEGLEDLGRHLLNEEDAESRNGEEFFESEKFSLHPWKCRTANLARNGRPDMDESSAFCRQGDGCIDC